jgi:ribosomal protein L7Ae-like RNA K-turn-binding protein
MIRKLKSMLGIAEKSGKLKSGNYQVEEAVKEGKAFLVLVAENGSKRTIKSYQDMCSFYETPIYIDGTIDEISQAIGKTNRAAICINDRSLGEALKKLIEEDMKTEDEAWQK